MNISDIQSHAESGGAENGGPEKGGPEKSGPEKGGPEKGGAENGRPENGGPVKGPAERSVGAADVILGATDDASTAICALPLGVLVYDDDRKANWLLAQSARRLAQSGCRLGGVVQSDTHRSGRGKCDMRLTDLLSGERVQISYDLGEQARGCRLDPAAFAHAGVLIERALAADIDLLIINKFGKQEAEGRGFRSVIAEALLSNIPVALAVSRRNLDACLEFAGGPFAHLAPSQTRIVAWCREAIRRTGDARQVKHSPRNSRD